MKNIRRNLKLGITSHYIIKRQKRVSNFIFIGAVFIYIFFYCSINELKKSETDLKALVSQLEMKLKTSSAAEAEMRAEREAELASLRSRCDNLSKSLEEYKDRVAQAEATASSAEATAKEQAERVASEATHASQLIQV